MFTLGNQAGHKHGHGADGKRSPTYHSWANMKSRCDHKTAPNYQAYGGRGITYCDAWATFDGFLADMGERPDGMTLDRIDVNGNYEPSNCRWLSEADQKRNTTRNVFLEFQGESMCLSDWAKRIGITRQSLAKRLKNGWSVEDALSRPPGRQGKPSA